MPGNTWRRLGSNCFIGSVSRSFGYRKARPGEDADTFGNVPVLRSLNKEFPDVQTLEGGRIDAVLVETV